MFMEVKVNTNRVQIFRDSTQCSCNGERFAVSRRSLTLVDWQKNNDLLGVMIGLAWGVQKQLQIR